MECSNSNATKLIYSLQSLSAHVWRCVTCARRPAQDQKASCHLTIDNRLRLEPPLLIEYFGNSVDVVSADATAGELLEKNLGWAAWKVYQLGCHVDPYCIMMSSSSRFNMYGNEFGMRKAVAFFSGCANKFDRNMSSYEGYEGGGSIYLAVTLTPDAMKVLETDDEFLNAVSVSNTM